MDGVRKLITPLMIQYSTVLCIFGLMGVSTAHAVAENSADPLLKWETLAQNHARVSPLSVAAPLGRLVLVRADHSLCAVRFLEFHRGHDAKPATAFNSGNESLWATAEEVQIEGSHKTVGKPEVISLERGPVVGLGRLGFAKGNIAIRCGGASLEWTYPNNISLGSYTQSPNYRKAVEIAPSAWTEVSQMDLKDPMLQWYRYDETRHDIVLNMDNLAGSSGR